MKELNVYSDIKGVPHIIDILFWTYLNELKWTLPSLPIEINVYENVIIILKEYIFEFKEICTF